MNAPAACACAAAMPIAAAKMRPSRFKPNRSRNKKAGVLRRPPNLPRNPKRRLVVLERILQADRYSLECLACKAIARGILAVGGKAVAARAEVEVPSGAVLLHGVYGVPVGPLVPVMLVHKGVHVRRVVDGTGGSDYLSRGAAARLPRRLPCVRPPNASLVGIAEFLSGREPPSLALPLVEVGIGVPAGQLLVDRVDCRARELVLDAHFACRLVSDSDVHGIIAGAVGLVVVLVGQDRVQATRFVDTGYAEGVAEGAVIAGADVDSGPYS